MAITDQDIRLMASEVLTDTEDGGGRMTGNEVIDGASNNLFPDVSELDRTIGRVSLRKAYSAVLSANTDSYYGSNIIIDKMPADPNVSVTLFSTKSWDDERDDAVGRMESYQARGPRYPGYLWDQHIAGQKAIMIVQRPDRPLPAIGSTLVIVEDPGGAGEQQQFVKVIKTSATEFIFSATSCGDFTRTVVTCEISDPLLFDVTGSIPNCNDDVAEASGNSRVYTSIVADAAKYAGMVALGEPAFMGDFSLKLSSIYTQLVPSAQVEVAITDTRANGDSSVYIQSGGEIYREIATSNSQKIYLGGGVLPNTLSATIDGGAEITDKAGTLVSNGVQIGTIDYSNGILTHSSVWSGGVATLRVTYILAVNATRNTQSAAWDVSAETRSGTIVFILDPVPAPGSLSVSFMAQGKWYVLRDDGTGALRGEDSSYGSGTVSYISGSVIVTMGALPDVGSSVIALWGTDLIDIDRSGPTLQAKMTLNATTPDDGGNPTSLARNGVALSWSDGNSNTLTAVDDGAGNLTGDASGRVNYVDRTIEFIPDAMPPIGAAITVASGYGPLSNAHSAGATTITLSTPPVPGTVKLIIPLSATDHDGLLQSGSVTLVDDAAGNLVVTALNYSQGVAGSIAGTVDYGTGVCTFTNLLASTIEYTVQETCVSPVQLGGWYVV